MSLLTGLNGTTVTTIYEFGTPVNGAYISGIPDGLGAYKAANGNLRILVNSELGPDKGFPYTLANGTQLTGGRLNYIEINNNKPVSVGLAYDTIYDRKGQIVTNGSQINGGTTGSLGFNRHCSANLIEADTFGKGVGFADTIFLIGEESGNFATMQAFDPATKSIHALPDLGYGGWESGTVLNTGSKDKVAVLLGDDNSAAPIYLYVGKKKTDSKNLLTRNGLRGGQMYVWCADSGASNSSSLAAGSLTSGAWKPINVRDAAKAGQSGFDADGYKYAATLRTEAKALNAFSGWRIEDVDYNPKNPHQGVFNTTGGQSTGTGSSSVGTGDYYGSTWTIDVTFNKKGNPTTGILKHLYDGDSAANKQNGIRSQDNVAWSANQFIYINEDRSVEAGADNGNSDWGSQEASIWKLDPLTGNSTRVAQVNRSGALPSGVTDGNTQIGGWETSGIIDVSRFFGHAPGRDFFTTVQAHGTTGGAITSQGLVEAGTIELLTFS